MTLLFDIYPAIGHLNASFALANQWREREHRVVYCSVEAEHKKRIEDNGFECVMLDYLLDSDKQELRVKGLRFILECVISAFTQEREQAFSRRAADWEKKIAELSPDRVCMDAQCAMHMALYHKLGIPVIAVETLPLKKKGGVQRYGKLSTYTLGFGNFHKFNRLRKCGLFPINKSKTRTLCLRKF